MTRLVEHHIETLYESGSVSALIFHCPGKTSHCEQVVEEYSEQHEIVFPLDGLFMRYDAFGRFIADSNHILFFNSEQPHEISHPVWGCDTSLIIRFRNDILLDLLGYYEPIEKPFTDGHRLLDSKQQLVKQQLLMTLAHSEQDLLAIEEYILHQISASLEHEQKQATDGGKMTIEQREAVFNAQCVLNQTFREKINLNSISQQVFYSEYALCRLFKQQVGTTIHQYLTALRLSQALHDLAEQPQKLIGDIGVELGFSSPSHFSTRFLNRFGMSPSYFREHATTAKIHETHKNLKASPIAS